MGITLLVKKIYELAMKEVYRLNDEEMKVTEGKETNLTEKVKWTNTSESSVLLFFYFWVY